MTASLSGFISVNKPSGITTYDIIRIIKKKTGLKKIGHAGTLDPFAEGVVIILLGQMTRLFDYFALLKKTYRGFAEFGKETDTQDITGTVINELPVPDISLIKSNIQYFTGVIKQKPPAYSAVHVNGIRAYELARKGIIPEIKEKNIHIYSLEANNYENNVLDFTVSCSSGTYIRTLASDLAQKCGSAAFLKRLLRISIGGFNIDDAVKPEEISENNIIKPETGFKILGIPVFYIDNDNSKKIIQGKDLSYILKADDYPAGLISFFTGSGQFLSLIENCESVLKYIFVSSDKNILYENN